MTIDEAIEHCEEVTQEKLYEYQECVAVHDTEDAMNCGKCAEEHRQLAEWLRDYKRLLEQQPCEDCIARRPLIDNWNSCADMLMNEGDSEIVMGWIFDAPPVTPHPKTGHWIGKKIIDREWKDYIVPLKDGFVTGSCSCSECGEWLTASDEYACYGRYCPNCGAKMERGDKK